jgi:subtilisin family serine protease
MVRRGWKIVVAAGNEAADACYTSPASAALAITVGATTQQQRLADFSNFGACVDILAPGDAILSAVPRNRYGYMSGTSMASPIVAGVWSLYPEREPRELLRLTVNNQVPMLPPGTPNRQLYNRPTYACGLLDPFAAFLLQT